MRKLGRIYRDYLTKIGKLPGEFRLGSSGYNGGIENEEVLIHESELLRNKLEQRFRFSNKILILAIVMLCILFFIGVYFIFHYRNDAQGRSEIFLGIFTVLFLMVKWLQVIWKEKIFIEISIGIFADLPPLDAAEKVAEFILILYKKSIARSLPPPKPIKKILILSSNPIPTTKLLLGEEVREIEEGLKRSKHREQFEIHSKWAVRLRDIRRALLDVNPHIVHFAGHGKENGLLVQDDLSMAVPIPEIALKDLFRLFSNRIECVILSACYSASQAVAISEHIEYVIGMQKEIKDRAAIEFAVGFYDALGAKKTVKEAFDFGRNAIQQLFPNQNEFLIPVLEKR